MANNMLFKTTLLKGDNGTGIDKTIPTGGVLYYDGDTVPEGYEQTTDPTEGGGGYSYEETTLYSGEGIYTGDMTLSDDISNYNGLIFKINDPQNVTSYLYLPTRALSVTNETANIGGYSQQGAMWFQLKRTADDKITILNNSGTTVKIYEVIGVKY